MRLRCAKVSVALPKIAMWRQPSSSARSRPRSLGTSTGRSWPASPESLHQLARRRRAGAPTSGARSWSPRRPAARRRAAARMNSALASTGTIAVLVLQPVARADLVDRDLLRELSGRDARLAPPRSPPRRAGRRAPPARRSRRRPTVTVPANGALSASSIFIASSTPSRWPSSTASPSATSTASTVPGIGAVRLPSPAAAPAPRRGRAARRRTAGPATTTSTACGVAFTTAWTRRPATSRRTTWCSAENWVTGTSSTRPRARSTRTTRSSSTRVGAGAALRRKPSARNGPWSPWSAASIAGAQRRDRARQVVGPGRDLERGRARRCRWSRRGTRRTRRAPAGSRRWW